MTKEQQLKAIGLLYGKKVYSREEVEKSHLQMCIDIAKLMLKGKSFSDFDVEQWIKDNLK